MSNEMVKKIEQMLHEEKWTRTAIGAYSVSHIKELDGLLQEVFQAGIQDEVQEICEHHLVESKDSIVALYLSGMISLDKQMLDDTNLVKLVNLFSKNLKWQVVENICQDILKYGENKFALRTLIECYKAENDEAQLFSVEERLIRIDIEEADIVFSLAQKFEKEKNTEKAVDHYKKAIHRYIFKKNFAKVREIWLKLLEFVPGEVDYFNQVEAKVAKTLGTEKAAQLLEDLYPRYFENENWDSAIQVQLKLNTYETRSPSIRKKIIECLKRKFADNSKTEEYIRVSNLGDSWKSLGDALEDFKKQMAYERGNFVYHKTWGVGRIREVRDQDFVIDFESKRDQIMGKKMAVEALLSLPKDDIRVVIATLKKADLVQKLKKEVDWALKTIIKSYGNSADMKLVKGVLVPKVFDEKEWTNWSSQARSLLKTSTDYAMSPDKQDQYTVRSQPITFEEKTYIKFKTENDFFKRVEILQDFLKVGKIESEYFPEIFASFANALKINKTNEEVVCAFLLVNQLVKTYPFLNPGITKGFNDYFVEIENLEDLFGKIQSTDLKKEFLTQVRIHVEEWPQVFARLFPMALNEDLIRELVHHGQEPLVAQLFTGVLEKYKEDRETFYWVAHYILEKDLIEHYKANREKMIISLVHVMDLSYRDILNKKDLSRAKRLNKALQTFLFKEKNVEKYLTTASQESTLRVFSLVNDMRELPVTLKTELKNFIHQRFPQLVLGIEEKAPAVSARKGTLATLKMFNAKKKELQNIIDLEVPKNSKEIATAMAMGDLKENAEYHAAKERQAILSATVAQLNKELESSTVIEKGDVDPAKVSFGTMVHLTNNLEGKQEVYTILGPWESDPNQNVISYLSPLGDRLLNARKGDHLKFTINERKCDFNVEKIEVADF